MSDLNLALSQFEKELQNEIQQVAVVKEVKVGELVLRTGQHLSSAMIVLAGSVKISREGDDGEEFYLYHIHPGEACAMSLNCLNYNETSRVTAVAIEPSTLLFIPMNHVNDWILKYRSWSDFVIQTYRNRFEEALQVIENVAFRGMDERLEFYLKKQMENCGCADLQLNHQAIAIDLNSSREVISRLLKKMEQHGKVKLHRNHIELLNV